MGCCTCHSFCNDPWLGLCTIGSLCILPDDMYKCRHTCVHMCTHAHTRCTEFNRKWRRRNIIGHVQEVN